MASVVSMRQNPLVLASMIVLPLLAGAPVSEASGPDGIALSVERAAVPGDLSLSWSGGQQPYLVYRSGVAASVVTADTRIAATTGTAMEVEAGPAPVDFFLVVNVDRNSPVTSTSDCLTAGTNARTAIVVELRDSLGHPLEGASVIINSDQGSVGPVESVGATYRALLAPPVVAGGAATVGVTADSTPLVTTPTVEFAEPLSVVDGGAAGCPADGNLRVRVVDEAGQPLPGAHVMVGLAEASDRFESTPGEPPDTANTGLTDTDGYLEFLDFGANLDGPQTVTAAATDRRYMTMTGLDAADVVLPLAPLDATVPGEIYTGVATPVPAPANDPIELAVMLPDVSLETVLSFSTADLVSDAECYDAGGVAGAAPMPGNVYIPSQCALQVFVCIQSLPEHRYTSAPLPYGDRRLLTLRGSAPLAALTAGDFNQVLGQLSFEGIGAVSRTASVPGPTVADLPVTHALNANLSCSIDNAPTASDVFCLSAGDWDSATDPGLSPGMGRILVTGFSLGDAAGVTGPFAISGVTTVNRTGEFIGIDYLAGAIAQYNDPLKPGIPPGTENGTSGILERSGTAYDESGGTVVFHDFFPIRTLTRLGRDFGLAELPGAVHPAAHVTRVALDQVITETYTACQPDDSIRTRRITHWEVYLPGDATAWILPTPPLGWPRQEAGGEFAGLVDPAATPEDDLIEQTATTLHLGTLPSFFWDRLLLRDIRSHVTHVTQNTVAY
jgi:hypothetical protein